MCGICGIINTGENAGPDEALVRRMCKAISHRGPDDEGVYAEKSGISAVLGHRRLSIIDLSQAGHQPMSNEDATIWLVLNGEIYNYKELRDELKNKGHIFKSNTDTETVIHLYEEYGKDCVKLLRGMFAFAIWDKKKQSLILARDRVGKKPLLYYHGNGKLIFASEFSGLLESGYVKKEIDHEAIHYYLTFGYIPAPLTIYKGVRKLLPAHTLVFENNELKIDRYWSLDYSSKLEIGESEAARRTIELLTEAVKIRLNSDVPLGAFLSGGIDSSVVVALMSRLSDRKVKTFSIGFNEAGYSELEYARNIAKKYNTEHNEFIVKPNAIEVLPLLVERYGEPYADSSCIPSYYVSLETKRYVTVALNGDGGDESFAGYERYQGMLMSDAYQNIPAMLRSGIRSLGGLLPDSINAKNRLRNIKRFLLAADLPTMHRYLRWIGVFDTNSKGSLYSDDFKNRVSGKDPAIFLEPHFETSRKLNMVDRALSADTNMYLPNDLLVKMDIASMANSLEARSPFLDHKVMEFAASLPAGYKIKNYVKKYILKKAIKGLVPDENVYRRKMGFGIPVGEWFRKEMKGFLCETVLSKAAAARNYFNIDAVKEMADNHIERRADHTYQLWALLMLELWHKRFID